jgi:hypothetical protein
MLDQRHFGLLLDETGTVGTPNGPICTLLKNRIPKALCEAVMPILRRASQSVAGGNRADAAGAGRKLRRRANGSISNISGTPRLEDMSYEDYLRLEGAKDGLVGYMAHGQRGGAEYPCRMTSWSLKQTPREFGLLNELAAFVGEAWSKSILHIQHSIQLGKAAEDTHSEYVMKTRRGLTPFTTITVNKSWRTAAHIDKGDLKQGFGAMCCFGDFDGCDLVFPRFKTAVRYREGDILLADVANQVHGNTPLLKPDGTEPKAGQKPERLVCVFYFIEAMEHCKKPDAERKRVNSKDRRKK